MIEELLRTDQETGTNQSHSPMSSAAAAGVATGARGERGDDGGQAERDRKRAGVYRR